LEKADAERNLLESIISRKLVLWRTKNLFGERICQKYHTSNKSTRKTAHNLARQLQDVDRAIVGGSSEGS